MSDAPRPLPARAADAAAGGGLVCYCFQFRRDEVEVEARAGSDRIFAAIRAQVLAGNCACGLRNPSGKCCLPEVRAILERAGLQERRR